MPEPDPDPLYERLRERIEADRGPIAWLRARPTPARHALLATSGIAVVTTVTLLTHSTLEDASLTFVIGLGALGLLAALSMAAALRPLFERGATPRGRLVSGAGVLAAALGAVAIGGTDGWGPLGGLSCFWVGAVVGLPVFALSIALDRAGWRGPLFGALSAGLVGLIAIQIACPATQLTHLLVAHFGALLVATLGFGAIGALVARRA